MTGKKFIICVLVAIFAFNCIGCVGQDEYKKEEERMREKKAWIFSELLPLIQNQKFLDSELHAYRFYYKLENGYDLILSMAKSGEENVLVLSVKNPDGEFVAKFTDFFSRSYSPYPVTYSEALFLSDFSTEGKIKMGKRYLLLLRHALVGLEKQSEL